jgi:hypothetical protein
MCEGQDCQETDGSADGVIPDPESGCGSSEHGCCPDKSHPAHGPGHLGCCAASNFSCCPDDVTPSAGPYGEGCDCKNSEYGCCPDELTPAKGPKLEGCGCQYEENGEASRKGYFVINVFQLFDLSLSKQSALFS